MNFAARWDLLYFGIYCQVISSKEKGSAAIAANSSVPRGKADLTMSAVGSLNSNEKTSGALK